MAGEMKDLVVKVVTSDPVAREISRAARIDEKLGALSESTDVAVSQTLQTYITGLEVGYVNSSDFSVTSGAAYIPGLDKIVEYPGSVSINASDLAGSPNQRHWYVYLYEDVDGVGQIDFSGFKPSNRYAGTARTKNPSSGAGYDEMRYLGYLNNQPSATLRRFETEADITIYTDSHTNTNVLSSGNATASTNVDLGNYVPDHVNLVWSIVTLSGSVGTNVKAYIGHPSDGLSSLQGHAFVEINANTGLGLYSGWLRSSLFSGSPNIRYSNSSSTGSTFIWVRGFIDPR